VNVSYPISSRPHIVWRHIDGPLLCGRHGELHWLTINERIFVCLGLDDEATFKENCEKQMIFEMGEAEYDRKYGY